MEHTLGGGHRTSAAANVEGVGSSAQALKPSPAPISRRTWRRSDIKEVGTSSFCTLPRVGRSGACSSFFFRRDDVRFLRGGPGDLAPRSATCEDSECGTDLPAAQAPLPPLGRPDDPSLTHRAPRLPLSFHTRHSPVFAHLPYLRFSYSTSHDKHPNPHGLPSSTLPLLAPGTATLSRPATLPRPRDSNHQPPASTRLFLPIPSSNSRSRPSPIPCPTPPLPPRQRAPADAAQRVPPTASLSSPPAVSCHSAFQPKPRFDVEDS